MGRNSNDRWTEDEDKRLLELRTKGKSNYWIAAALRRSLTSVAARLYVLKKRSANGAKVTLSDRKRLQWNSADEDRLVELKAEGIAISEIANQLKRTEAAVENRLHVIKHRAPAT
jgi:DNA-binding CsgD family transcriptional regulator